MTKDIVVSLAMLIVPPAVLLIVSGCSVERVRFAPFPALEREFGRTDVGRIEAIKASPDKETAYWQTQKQHDGLRLGGQ